MALSYSGQPEGHVDPLEWQFSQVFGERQLDEPIQDADIISAVGFDHTGDFLATGDQGGRVVLFERIATRPTDVSTHPDQRGPSSHHFQPYEYRYLTEFQSHEPEFDYLKSVEIEEKINKVRWLRRWNGQGGLSVLTTNDKTIKLWKVYEKKVVSLSEFNLQNGSSTLNRAASLGSPDKLAAAAVACRPRADAILRVPRVIGTETLLASKCRRTYSAAHTYHINSIALSYDEETFLSADDLRINLWNLDRSDTAFTVVDIKPTSMEDLTEVITAADFHPTASHIFAYASSKGSIKLADLRAAALCDGHAKSFEDIEVPESERNFFSEIIASVNDIRFIGPGSCGGPPGTHLLTRDYMNLKLWDIRMERGPVEVYKVQEPLRNRLCELYETDAIFDKFDLAASSDGSRFATGTYSNFFKVIARDGHGAADQLLETSRDPTRRRLAPGGGPKLPGRFVGFGRSAGRQGRGMGLLGANNGTIGGVGPSEDVIGMDLSTKIQHLSYHPQANVMAVAAANSLFLMYGRDTNQMNSNRSW